MAEKLDQVYSFTSGCVINENFIIIAAEVDHLAGSRPHSQILQYINRQWSNFIIEWPVVSMCMLKDEDESLLSLGVNGNVHIAEKKGFFEESIDEGVQGPPYSGTMSEIKVIDSAVYAVGMGRQVYRRISKDNWIRLDHEIRQSLDNEEIKGLLSIDGCNSEQFYAVGYSGEIWYCHCGEWHEINSPTNMDLHCVKCISPDHIYIAGQNGVLVHGQEDSWEIVLQEQDAGDFWGLEYYNGVIYVSSDQGVFSLTKGSLVKQDIGEEGPSTGGTLHSQDGVLWSFGTKYLSYKDRSNAWKSVQVPK